MVMRWTAEAETPLRPLSSEMSSIFRATRRAPSRRASPTTTWWRLPLWSSWWGIGAVASSSASRQRRRSAATSSEESSESSALSSSDSCASTFDHVARTPPPSRTRRARRVASERSASKSVLCFRMFSEPRARRTTVSSSDFDSRRQTYIPRASRYAWMMFVIHSFGVLKGRTLLLLFGGGSPPSACRRRGTTGPSRRARHRSPLSPWPPPRRCSSSPSKLCLLPHFFITPVIIGRS
mmetsp:Transcript_3119/g.10307  ORF Transcript_3119/g.10307 Transcript_3119/m.10307 type:complete len:237 (+) Transcript_3119:536-1246(+)